MIEITTEFGKGSYTPVNTKEAVMAGPGNPEPTLLNAVEGAINNCAKAINTIEAKAVKARQDMCELLLLRDEVRDGRIPPIALKYLFDYLEDNL